MPKSRLPKEIWDENIRPKVRKRDSCKCTKCNKTVSLQECHIDHIVSGKFGSNKISNLRTLCIYCHSLRQCNRHRGLTAKSIERGMLPAKWRHLTWDD